MEGSSKDYPAAPSSGCSLSTSTPVPPSGGRSQSVPSKTRLLVIQRNGVVFDGDLSHVTLDVSGPTVAVLPQYRHIYAEFIKVDARITKEQKAALAKTEIARSSPAWRAAFETRTGRPYVPAEHPGAPPTVFPPLEPNWRAKAVASFAEDALKHPCYANYTDDLENVEKLRKDFVASYACVQLLVLGRELLSRGAKLSFDAVEDKLLVRAGILLRNREPGEYSKRAQIAMWSIKGHCTNGIIGLATHQRSVTDIQSR